MNNRTYDVIFCGLGVGSCLLIRELHRRNILQTLSICILDPNYEKQVGKSLCFWAEPDSKIVTDNYDIISQCWSRAEVPPLSPQSIAPFCYYKVQSHLLYQSIATIIQEQNIEVLSESVLSITEEGKEVTVISQTGERYGKRVFDNRPPQNSLLPENLLKQSFWGFYIQLEHSMFDVDKIVFMDFHIPQDDYTQFIYILPESTDRALVEVTRFGTEVLDESLAKKRLHEYIAEHIGLYMITEEESGVIPMTANPFDVSSNKYVTHLGTCAGAVKPSTGYAFATMFEHAQRICEDFTDMNVVVNRNVRFLYYDRLLIDILVRYPSEGRFIFKSLFQAQSVRQVLFFLQEATSIFAEIKIFLSLPWRPFLRAAYRDVPSKREILTLVMALLYVCLVPQFPEVLHYTFGFILGCGLFFIGIPHGSIDHMVVGERGTQPWNLKFIGAYLSLICLIIFCWMISPTWALFVFLVSSAWHFGQTDFIEWKIEKTFGSFFWGMSLLFILIGTHINETIPILMDIHIDIPHFAAIHSWSISTILLCANAIFAIRTRSLSWLINVVLLLVLSWCPLPIAFGLYFITQHSISAWGHLSVNLANRNSLWKHTIPFSLGAYVTLFILFVLFRDFFQMYQGVIVVFLAAISFPHILCMTYFYKKIEVYNHMNHEHLVDSSLH